MPVKEVKNPEIGKIDCPCCGNSVPLRINCNGCVYIFCNHVLDGGERCFYRVTYGKKHSRELINNYSAGLPAELENNHSDDQKNGVENGIGFKEVESNIGPGSQSGTKSVSDRKPRSGIFGAILTALDE